MLVALLTVAFWSTNYRAPGDASSGTDWRSQQIGDLFKQCSQYDPKENDLKDVQACEDLRQWLALQATAEGPILDKKSAGHQLSKTEWLPLLYFTFANVMTNRMLAFAYYTDTRARGRIAATAAIYWAYVDAGNQIDLSAQAPPNRIDAATRTELAAFGRRLQTDRHVVEDLEAIYPGASSSATRDLHVSRAAFAERMNEAKT